MIVSLKVNTLEKGRGIKKIINSIKPDKISVEIKKARGVCLKNITYTTYTDKIKLDRLLPYIRAQSRMILCSEDLRFPVQSGFMRFSSTQFSVRLCTNMTLGILQSCNSTDNIRLGIYDPAGESSDFLFYALQYCSNVTAATDELESYRCQVERAMDEFGASAVVTNRAEDLSECNLIVAPCVISEPLQIRETAVVLTVRKPKVVMPGQIYYKYQLRMPNGFSKIKPPEFDDEYFCSALYTLENQYELGSIVPLSCSNEVNSQTVRSVCDIFKRLDCN